MFVFIILWVRAEPSWMSFPLPFNNIILQPMFPSYRQDDQKFQIVKHVTNLL